VVARTTLAVAVVLGAVGCNPALSDTTSEVTAPRLIAVSASPAEAQPGGPFTLTALYVSPDGGADASTLSWAICLLPPQLGDPDSVNQDCVAERAQGLSTLGHGGVARGDVPSAACELFGPESLTPPPAAGQPASRPTDPDSTGGYYLPIVVTAERADEAVAFERIVCQPSGVTPAVFNQYESSYLPNENPSVLSLSLQPNDAGAAVTVSPVEQPDAAMLAVRAGSTNSLQVSWPICPLTPATCEGAETFVVIDSSSQTVQNMRESMVASWYASAGSFALDRVGRAGTDTATTAVNTWTAPAAAGTVRIWVVLRDARGGVGWASYVLAVAP
jgi:hypothetical protein